MSLTKFEDSSFKVWCFVLFLVGLVSGQEDSGTRIVTVGYGTFTIILSVALAMLICIVARNTTHPELYSIVALLLPLFFILFFVFVPKKRDQPAKQPQTDINIVTHAIFCTIFVIMFLVALFFYFGDIIFVYKKARNIAWTGVASSAPVQEDEIAPSQHVIKQDAGSQNALIEPDKQE